jgi:hypothetical protein
MLLFPPQLCSDASYIIETSPILNVYIQLLIGDMNYTGGADNSLARPGRKQARATEDFEFHISYL